MSEDAKSNIEKLMAQKNVEFRDFTLTKIETRSNGQTEELIVEGIACPFATETVLYKGQYCEYREIIESTALDSADMADVIFNANHCGRVYARTRNKTLELSICPEGLHMRATLMNNDEGHAQLYRDIKTGLIDKMSFAFKVKRHSYEYIENSNDLNVELRRVHEIEKVYDVSAVDIPAYDTTSISARSVFDVERQKRKAESRNRAKKQLQLKLKLQGV